MAKKAGIEQTIIRQTPKKMEKNLSIEETADMLEVEADMVQNINIKNANPITIT